MGTGLCIFLAREISYFAGASGTMSTDVMLPGAGSASGALGAGAADAAGAGAGAAAEVCAGAGAAAGWTAGAAGGA